ncbi:MULTISPECIES: cytochrome aa3 quinol oxidase subunit IV [Geobacillus]|uniref:Quinol oxidase subunit 4 n=4 Tax=Geobacillus TaxID=129337 RepID=Q5KU95_GEOKA|nr:MULTISPECIES: cytochrome aa3 quinol oxidase subunit IV [Geobacillus]MED0652604.1 cytochrome aa3 quinol oxidase subunit IV [Anoxybacillus geothermalis]AMV12595.1 quinol oxidase subunit 4 [Geobacillus thermoleovorans]ATA61767.1 cytochrome aa3 quinol oxidase subunit IV [Geobacillus stearothermophilus]AUI36914.1 cytochrome aa3 quinol oxidase subunit IV [[Bacillus] caldolyticus]AWO74415.1 cytochrome aa3 quinol oxidase subunit IV [Geobacillus thermoleovorans]
MGANSHRESFPWKHIIGFLLSLVLTFAALWVALSSGLPLKAVIVIIVLFAIIQASLQLFLFMHVNESDSGKVQTFNMVYSFFIAVVVVAGSIWVMQFVL